MGNVQCCASGRFREGKPPKEPKNKKNKKKQTKDCNKKNGVSGGGGKVDQGVKKVVTVAEDGSERAAPAETLVQATSPAADTSTTSPQQDSLPQNNISNVNETDYPRGESMTTARERFFGQVFQMLY